MYISKLIIRNFRNFRNAAFHFTKGINTLIGENGSGKTNAFYALRLLIDDSLSKRAINLEESDFNRSLGIWRGHWIIITAEFDELDESEATQILAVHGMGRVDGSAKGTYTLYFRPRRKIRNMLFELSKRDDKTPADLNDILSNITIQDYEGVTYCRGSADFSDEELYKKHVGDFENILFPDPGELSEDELGVPHGFWLSNEVSCTFVKALRDVVSDLRNMRANPLLILLRGSSKNIEVSKSNKITENVKHLNESIANLDEIQRISSEIKSTMTRTVGATYSPNIQIRSELPDDIEKLLASLTLWVGDPGSGDYQGQLRELSLGGANLIYLTLKLLEYERDKSNERAAHILLIEEPEAHIHTHIQKTLFEKYGYYKTQVIISTHSTHISAASKIRSVNILAAHEQEARVYHPSSGLNPDECTRIERYLDAVRSTLLFAKGVMLVEGDAELILLPSLFRSAFGLSLDEIGVSLINMSSAVFANIARIFSSERINRPCAVITDLDRSIVPLGKDKSDDDNFQKSCRDSQDAGLARARTLLKSFKGNPYVKVYFAKHTFEVEFVAAGNQFEVQQSISSIYSRSSDIDKSSRRIGSDDVAVYGREVLRLANKLGKGWFALLASEHVHSYTFIPNYILKAIAFAGSGIREGHLFSMARYRVDSLSEIGSGAPYTGFAEFIDSKLTRPYSPSDYLRLFQDQLPDDDLNKLMKYMGVTYAE